MAVYSARGNGFVPHLRVRAVGVVVDIGVGVHKLAQCKLVMKAARDSGDALERIRFRLTLGEVAAIERGRLVVDHTSTEVGHLVALIPAVRRPEDKPEVGDGGTGVGDLDHELDRLAYTDGVAPTSLDGGGPGGTRRAQAGSKQQSHQPNQLHRRSLTQR